MSSFTFHLPLFLFIWSWGCQRIHWFFGSWWSWSICFHFLSWSWINHSRSFEANYLWWSTWWWSWDTKYCRGTSTRAHSYVRSSLSWGKSYFRSWNYSITQGSSSLVHMHWWSILHTDHTFSTWTKWSHFSCIGGILHCKKSCTTKIIFVYFVFFHVSVKSVTFLKSCT